MRSACRVFPKGSAKQRVQSRPLLVKQQKQMITDDQKQAVEDWLTSELNERQTNRPRWEIMAAIPVIFIVAVGLLGLFHGLTGVH